MPKKPDLPFGVFFGAIGERAVAERGARRRRAARGGGVRREAEADGGGGGRGRGGAEAAGAEANAMGQRGGRRQPRRVGISGGGLDLRRGKALKS